MSRYLFTFDDLADHDAGDKDSADQNCVFSKIIMNIELKDFR